MHQERKSNKISYDLITFLFKKNEKKKIANLGTLQVI